MKRIKKCLLVLILGVTIITSSMPVHATEKDNEYYALRYKFVADLIKNQYLDSEGITEQQIFDYAMQGIFDQLDIHSDYMIPAEEEAFTNQLSPTFVGVGMQFGERNGQLVVLDVFSNSPATEAGVKKGDVLYKVDDVEITGKDSNSVAELLLGLADTKVKLEVYRGGKSVVFEMIRRKINIPTARVFSLKELDENISDNVNDAVGYIQLSTFGEGSDKEFEGALNQLIEEEKEYLVLDLRNNSGGYVNVAVNIGNMIVPEGEFVTFIDNSGNTIPYYSELEEAPMKIVTLVNEYSASASEILATAIQDSGVGVIVGETSYGKGVAQFMKPLGDGYSVKLTFQEFISRNHNKINGIGVIPDYEVKIPNYISTRYRLFKNDQNEDVHSFEEVLAYLGYQTGIIDDTYDEYSFQGMKDFQRDNGLYAYGIADYKTQDMLNSALQEKTYQHDTQLEQAVKVIKGMMAE